MDVREKLVELIVDAMPPCYSDVFATQIADHLIAHGVTVQEWISVEDRLPEENTAVLAHRESGIEVEFRWSRHWDYDDFASSPVTHWMPLPEPPKGE